MMANWNERYFDIKGEHAQKRMMVWQPKLMDRRMSSRQNHNQFDEF